MELLFEDGLILPQPESIVKKKIHLFLFYFATLYFEFRV